MCGICGEIVLTPGERVTFETYPADDLLVKADRCSMASSLEVRWPFLDWDIIEYVTMLPDEFKLARGRSTVILREAFAGLVPTEILPRKKMDWTAKRRHPVSV